MGSHMGHHEFSVQVITGQLLLHDSLLPGTYLIGSKEGYWGNLCYSEVYPLIYIFLGL